MAEFVTYAGYPLLSAIAEAVTTANEASAAAAAQREAARHPVSETEVGGDGDGAGGS
jgi:IMP dehydrogenase/GMP reductase